MLKIIIWIVLIFGVLFALRMINIAAARRSRRQSGSTGNAPPEKTARAMVRCTRCGVFLPQADAKRIGNGYVCSDKGCADHR